MRKLLLLIVYFTVLQQIARTQDIHFSKAEPPKEEAWPGIHAITQDINGYLWLATEEGLYKYDGHQYIAYQHDPANTNSLSIDNIESVLADDDGYLWIGTFGSGLNRLDRSTGKFTHYRHQAKNSSSLGNDTVTAIIKDHDGMIWLGTYHGIAELNPKTGLFKNYAHNKNDVNSLSNNQVRVIYEDRQQTLWIGTGSVFNQETPAGEGGLNKLDKTTGKFTRYLHNADNPATLINNRVRAIFEDSRGTFWVGTAGDGLHTMDRKAGTFKRYPYDAAHPENPSRPPLKNTLNYGEDHITFINEDNNGKIWIGTFENGINVYDPVTQKTVWYGADQKNGNTIAGNDFWCSYKTRDGVLWVASWAVVELYKINPYQNDLPAFTTGYPVYGFTEDTPGSFWMATGKGLVYKAKDNSLATYYINKNRSAAENVISSVEKDDQNKLWLRSSLGLYRFDPVGKTFTGYHHQPGNANSLTSDSVSYLKKSTDGKIWVGTENGLDLVDTRTGAFKHFKNDRNDPGSISNNAIRVIENDKNNNTWIGTGNGLNRLDKTTTHFKRYLDNLVVYFIKIDNDGNFWALTNKNIYKYDRQKDSFSVFGKAGLVGYWAEADHEKDIWLNTAKGVVKLNTQNAGLHVYGKEQGVTGNLWGGYIFDNDEILYGNNTGYYDFYPDKLLHRYPAAVINFDSFLLADVQVATAPGGVIDTVIENKKLIDLNYKQTTFSIGFKIIDYVSKEGTNQNVYMLENYDSKWRKANNDESASYYNVPAGTYKFKVKCTNYNGLTSEKEISIIISPPWWHKWWAYAIFIVLFAGSVWAFIFYRSRRLIKENRVLERKVQVRTEEVMQQKEEIEAQRDNLETQRNNLEKTLDELKQTQNRLIQSEKMASLGELTSGIAHEIQNPLNFVNNFSELNAELIEELQNELSSGAVAEALAIANDISENEKKINIHGKRADAIVKGMLQHSAGSTGERELKDINVLTDEFLKIGFNSFRTKDKFFNAALVTHYAENLPPISIVPQEFGRVLLNIFNNAFYALNQKKQTAGSDFMPGLIVTTLMQNNHIVISIKDNGCGIPNKIKEKIMQPFFTTKPTGEGTGLGLFLAYDLVVKGLGGKITVDSAEGEYSEFVIKLPLRR